MAFTPRTESYYYIAGGLSYPYSVSINKPSGTVEGDILFTLVAWFSTGKPLIDWVPDGWIKIAEHLGNNDQQALYYKIAGDSEPASYSWSFDGDARIRIVCSCYTGGDFDADDPIDVYSNTEYRIDNTTVRAASMVVSAANSPLIFWAMVLNIPGAITFTKPSAPETWIEDDDAGDSGSDIYIEVCSQIWTGSGATGNMDATASSSIFAKHAFAVALNPAGGGFLEASYSGLAIRLVEDLAGYSAAGTRLITAASSFLGLSVRYITQAAVYSGHGLRYLIVAASYAGKTVRRVTFWTPMAQYIGLTIRKIRISRRPYTGGYWSRNMFLQRGKRPSTDDHSRPEYGEHKR